jgi:hypothetical protein
MVFWGFALPAIGVAVGLILAWRAWRRADRLDGRWISGLLIGGGFALAFPWLEQGHPAWPPGADNAACWCFYFAIALGLLGFLQDVLRPPAWLGAIILLLLWRLAMRAILAPEVPGLLSNVALETWTDAASVAALLLWLAMQQLAANAPGPTTPIVLGIWCAGWAVMLVTWHIIHSGELAGTLALMCAAAAAIGIWRRRISLAGGGITAVVLLLLCLIVHAYFYSDDAFSTGQQWRTVILLLAAPAAFAGDLPVIRRARPGWRLAARVAVVLLAVGIVAGISVAQFAAAQAANQAADE